MFWLIARRTRRGRPRAVGGHGHGGQSPRRRCRVSTGSKVSPSATEARLTPLVAASPGHVDGALVVHRDAGGRGHASDLPVAPDRPLARRSPRLRHVPALTRRARLRHRAVARVVVRGVRRHRRPSTRDARAATAVTASAQRVPPVVGSDARQPASPVGEIGEGDHRPSPSARSIAGPGRDMPSHPVDRGDRLGRPSRRRPSSRPGPADPPPVVTPNAIHGVPSASSGDRRSPDRPGPRELAP